MEDVLEISVNKNELNNKIKSKAARIFKVFKTKTWLCVNVIGNVIILRFQLHFLTEMCIFTHSGLVLFFFTVWWMDFYNYIKCLIITNDACG